MAKVLAIGDTHLPAVHPGYLAFCSDLYDKYKCDTAVHIGDFVDHHAISAHDPSPEADGPIGEYALAMEQAEKWHRVFPNLKVCEGNHDVRITRMAAKENIPSRFLRGYNELYHTPKWEWATDHTIDDVYYVHGTGCGGGLLPSFNIMSKMLLSVVSGHVHTSAGILWRANKLRRIFGCNTGCGVDDRHIAFQYAENIKIRSILSAAVILDGVPYHHVMAAGRGEKYDRARFKKGKT